eukprot:gene29374-33172_t
MFTYQKLDPNAPNYFAYNRGTETGVYLKYIVDHYHDFPDVAIFVHAKPYEHQVNWLNMIGCISPNATWFNINYGQAGWNTRSPEFWEEDGVVQEQCWRDILQVLWELRGRDKEFHRRLPPTQPITSSATCCNQFLLSRAMVHKRPLHVWKELLQIIAMQPMCHMGEPDYENLFEFNRTGRVNKSSEKLFYEKFGESLTNQKGSYVQGHAGEHLMHVMFGHKELEMTPPSQEEICQNFIQGCPGSPCKGPPEHVLSHRTMLVNTKLSPSKYWYMVLHKGKRHSVPDMDTLDGLDIP